MAVKGICSVISVESGLENVPLSVPLQINLQVIWGQKGYGRGAVDIIISII